MPEVKLELAPNEHAAVLLEQNGVFSWHCPDNSRTQTQPPTRVGPQILAANKEVVIPLDLGKGATSTGPGSRGILGDVLLGAVRAVVFKFVAGAIIDCGVKLLERHVQSGIIVLDSGTADGWRRVEDLSHIALPVDRPARILIFFHGTFSSTIGSFGALSSTPWGKEFLAAALGAYDAVIGFDHPTLSADPLENALDFLQRFRKGIFAGAPCCDAVAYSRGALVYRSLIEHLIPAADVTIRFERAVFVGPTNGGTLLACPENWERLADLYTNLAVAGSKALSIITGQPVMGKVFTESVKSLGALVKHLASESLTQGRIPGLAAMEPEGDFVKTLNGSQPGQPSAGQVYNAVICSTFDTSLLGSGAEEFSENLKRWLAQGFVQQLMREPSDLVVNVASMRKIDPDGGAFVSDVYNFGSTSNVYHTNYFTRPETAGAMARWLQLPPPGTDPGPSRAPAGSIVPALVDTDITIVGALDSVESVSTKIVDTVPSFVVVERIDSGRTYHYAFGAEELGPVLKKARPGATLFEALGPEPDLSMHEHTASFEITPARAGEFKGKGSGLTGQRAIVMIDDLPKGVIGGPKVSVTTSDLGKLAGIVDAEPQDLVNKVRVRRAMPTFTKIPPPEVPREVTVKPKELGKGPSRDYWKRRFPIRVDESVPVEPPVVHAPARGTCYFQASMPNEVAVGQEAVVNAALSREDLGILKKSISQASHSAIDLTTKISVRVIPRRGLTLVNPAQCHWLGDPPAKGTPVRLEFKVMPTDPGDGEVHVLFKQGTIELARFQLRPAIVSGAAKATGMVSDVQSMPDTGPVEQVPMLEIFEQTNGKTLTYLFSFKRFDNEGYITFEAGKTIDGSREAYVASIYKKIEGYWGTNKNDFKAFYEDLRALGADLFDELMPAGLKAKLWELRDSLQGILVLSMEPFIPWELVHLKPPPPPGEAFSPLPEECRFLGQLGITRWLHNAGGFPPRRVQVREDRAFCCIPDYPLDSWKLPSATEERPFLENAFHAKDIAADVNTVRDFLKESGQFDLFHFAGHGFAESADIAHAQIAMAGRVEDGRYLPSGYSCTTARHGAKLPDNENNRPIVVFNACQIGRLGYRLTSIGGFAEAFVGRYAGVFVGSVWSVGDRPAKDFTEALYTALLKGETLARSTVLARDAARKAGDVTWMAYVVYGHPSMTLQSDVIPVGLIEPIPAPKLLKFDPPTKGTD